MFLGMFLHTFGVGMFYILENKVIFLNTLDVLIFLHALDVGICFYML